MASESFIVIDGMMVVMIIYEQECNEWKMMFVSNKSLMRAVELN